MNNEKINITLRLDKELNSKIIKIQKQYYLGSKNSAIQFLIKLSLEQFEKIDSEKFDRNFNI